MQHSRISYNVLQDNRINREALLGTLTAMGAAGAVVIENTALAQDIKRALPDALVINRRYALAGVVGDGNLHMVSEPARYLDLRMAHGDHIGGLILYTTNEPGEDFPRLARWHEQLLDEATKRGVRLCVLNPSVGRFNVARYGNNEWALFRGVLERLAAGGHVLGVHEYLDAPELTANVPHFIGRINDVLAYADSVGIPPFDVAITEFGLDDANMSGGKRGWKDYEQTGRWYADILLNTFAQVYTDPRIRFAAVFGYGDSGWQTFDVQHAADFHARLIETAQDAVPEPERPPAPPPPAPVYDAKQQDDKLRAAVEALQGRVDALEARAGVDTDALTNFLDALGHVQTGLARLRTALELLQASE